MLFPTLLAFVITTMLKEKNTTTTAIADIAAEKILYHTGKSFLLEKLFSIITIRTLSHYFAS